MAEKKTTTTRTKKKAAPKKKPLRVIWVYGLLGVLVERFLGRITAIGMPESNRLRGELSIKVDQELYSCPAVTEADRIKFIKEQLEVAEGVILIGGLPEDRGNTKIQALFGEDHHEAIWLHPKEKAYYVDTMGVQDAPTWEDMEEAIAEARTFLGKFKKFSIVR